MPVGVFTMCSDYLIFMKITYDIDSLVNRILLSIFTMCLYVKTI
jgi:hypothetical protein